jgi:hypothetical protein
VVVRKSKRRHLEVRVQVPGAGAARQAVVRLRR